MEILNNYKELFKYKSSSRYYVITGGRGSGKSFTVNTFLLNLTYEIGHVILFTRWTMVSAHISIIPEFIDKIEALGKHDDFDIQTTEIVNKITGSRIIFKGIKTSQGTATANLKSIAGVTTWVLDEAEELTDEDVFDKIDLSIRHKELPNKVILVMNPSFKTHWVYQRFVKHKRNDTTYIHTTYLNNRRNLSQSFIDQAENLKVINQHRYNHLFLGHWLDQADGLLWNRNIIERLRIETKPDLKRIVVAIDPAISANENSDETGIIVCANDSIGNGYVLEDLSGKYSPNEWANIAVNAFKRWDADCIVAEKNQGGDMVSSVLRSQNATARIKLVTATKGKYVRAEPIFSLYEQNKIYHVGMFPILETQMITFNPDKVDKSPDRVDALVWGFTELMLNKAQNNFVVSKGKVIHT
jgi:PBSX family phage terminase large subunit